MTAQRRWSGISPAMRLKESDAPQLLRRRTAGPRCVGLDAWLSCRAVWAVVPAVAGSSSP